MNKILVTGADGFIGYNLCNYLRLQGHTVTGIDLHPERIAGDCERGFRRVTGDFRDQDLMQELMMGVDVVFHLASAHLRVNLSDSEYWDINVHSLPKLLELARRNGVKRFVHVSSVGVYGNLKTWPADEETPVNPQSIYGETKLAGESTVREYGDEYGFPVVVLRPSWVYGRMCPRTRKLYRSLRKRRFIMIGSGTNLRHPIYIDDLLRLFELTIERDEAVGELFLAGGDRALTTKELVETFCTVLELPRPRVRIPFWVGRTVATGAGVVFKLLSREPPLSRRTLEFFETNNCFDISKARRRLGFSSRFSLEEGLKDCAEWLRADGSREVRGR